MQKGTQFLISLADIAKNPSYYISPTEFRPERWDPQSSFYHSFSKQSFYPFSMGERRCVGQWFAQFEFRTFIAAFLREKLFSIELVDKKAKCLLKNALYGLTIRKNSCALLFSIK